MASTYTLNTGIELIANGEQSGTWGTTTNVNLEIIDRLTNGVGAITLSGTTHTLTTTDGTLSDGQFKVLVFGGSPSGTNTVTISPNDQDKQYFILNSSGQSVVLTQGSGGNVTIANGKSAIVFADGGGAGAAVTDLTATFVPAGALLAANNLSDVANAGTARTNSGRGHRHKRAGLRHKLASLRHCVYAADGRRFERRGSGYKRLRHNQLRQCWHFNW
jgi:hypothetical protein